MTSTEAGLRLSCHCYKYTWPSRLVPLRLTTNCQLPWQPPIAGFCLKYNVGVAC